jgi:hypothetical protein
MGARDKAFGALTKSTAERAGESAGFGSSLSEYGGNIASGITSGGKKGGVSSAIAGAAERGLNYAPAAFGYKPFQEGSSQAQLNAMASKVMSAAATGSRGGAVGALAEGATKYGLEKIPEMAGYAKPESGSTTDRLNRFASRVVGGAAAGAALTSPTGPGMGAGALAGAVAGGAYDLAETGMELINKGIDAYKNSGSKAPQPAEKMSFSQEMGKISQAPNMPSWKKNESFGKKEPIFSKETNLLASALR